MAPLSRIGSGHTEHSDLTIISGGTATNLLVSTLQSLSPRLSFILPISDNGGSTAEIMRVFGGPGIGDLRSRLTRLIPDKSSNLREIFGHRLSTDRTTAKHEWLSLVEGTHVLWMPISPGKRELIRAFLVHVQMEIAKRTRPHREFQYEDASVGNLFLTGARLFTGSLLAAVELFERVTEIDSSVRVLPAINSNFSHHIAAVLENGVEIRGQSQISHPSKPMPGILHVQLPNSDHSEDAYPPFTHPDLLMGQQQFSKESGEATPLPSPISRIYYINPYGQEIYPSADTRVLEAIRNTKILIYSIGSLFTSIAPVLVLNGIGESIKMSTATRKILLVNGSEDRETSGGDSFTLSRYVKTVHEACLSSLVITQLSTVGLSPATYQSEENDDQFCKPSDSPFITDVVYLDIDPAAVSDNFKHRILHSDTDVLLREFDLQLHPVRGYCHDTLGIIYNKAALDELLLSLCKV